MEILNFENSSKVHTVQAVLNSSMRILSENTFCPSLPVKEFYQLCQGTMSLEEFDGILDFLMEIGYIRMLIDFEGNFLVKIMPPENVQ